MADIIFHAAPDRRILRYEVPVDGQWHVHLLSGAALHVAARRPDVVELWAMDTGVPGLRRAFRVLGTGEPLPATEDVRHVGTALIGPLVWHLIELWPGAAEVDRA